MLLPILMHCQLVFFVPPALSTSPTPSITTPGIHQLSLLIFHCTHYISSHWRRDYRWLILKLIIAVHRLVSYLASFVQVVLAMHDFQTKRAMSKCVPCHGVFFKTVIVVGFDFCDIWNNQGLGKWYHPRLIILKFHSPNGS